MSGLFQINNPRVGLHVTHLSPLLPHYSHPLSGSNGNRTGHLVAHRRMLQHSLWSANGHGISAVREAFTEPSQLGYCGVISGLLLFAQTPSANQSPVSWLMDAFWNTMASPYYWLICLTAGVIKIGLHLHAKRSRLFDLSEEDINSRLFEAQYGSYGADERIIREMLDPNDSRLPFQTLVSPPRVFAEESKESGPTTEEGLQNNDHTPQTRVESVLEVLTGEPKGTLSYGALPMLTPIATTACPSCNAANSTDNNHCSHCALPLIPIEGKYRIVGVISTSGGQGVVYKAVHQGLKENPERAIKVIKCGLSTIDPITARRFEDEVNASHALSSQNPHVVRVHDSFGYHVTLGGFYYVMEYLQGVSLNELISSQGEGSISPARALGIFSQICDALSAAHRRGIYHRDMKPANIMLVQREEEGNFVKIIDFGIAKLLTAAVSPDPIRTQGCVGTPEYMPPEQWGGRCGPQTDIYALGLIFYELLTGGKRPFPADRNPLVMAGYHLTAVRTPMSAHRGLSHLNPLDKIVERAIMPRQQDRYRTIDEFLAAVRLGIEGIEK